VDVALGKRVATPIPPFRHHNPSDHPGKIRPMNHVVAYQLLAAELNAYRDLPYSELRQLVGDEVTRCALGEDGISYSLTTVVRWRLEVGGDITVSVFVGEASWGSPYDSLDDTIVIPKYPEGKPSTPANLGSDASRT
jgi:hypothetical protein